VSAALTAAVWTAYALSAPPEPSAKKPPAPESPPVSPAAPVPVSPVPPADPSAYRLPSEAVRAEIAPPGKTVRPPVLGLHFRDGPDGRATVDAVLPESPAARERVEVGDVVLEFNGSPAGSAERLGRTLRAADRAAGAELLVLRGGTRLRKTLIEPADPAVPPIVPPAVAGIEFPDAAHNPAWKAEDWEQLLFSRGRYNTQSPTGEPVHGSAADWLAEQSCGRFTLSGRFLGWFRFPERKAAVERMVMGAALLDAGGASTDWPSQAAEIVRRGGKDAAGFEAFDAIAFVVAGPISGRPGTQLWPHQATLRVAGRTLPYIVLFEDGRRFPSISVAVHELGHVLGLPDQFGSQQVDNLGLWCTMATGHKGLEGGRGARPNHLCAWCKMRLGWLRPTPVDPRAAQHLRLRPVENSADQAFQVLLQPDGSEYLLLENRGATGFDAELPAPGLLAWRVTDYGKVELEPAHGLRSGELSLRIPHQVPFPQPDRDSLTPLTSPTGRARTPFGRDAWLCGIRRHANGEVTFSLGFEFH
jgi:M6 family metalloprotease-like protein